jgi:hypothetical protein
VQPVVPVVELDHREIGGGVTADQVRVRRDPIVEQHRDRSCTVGGRGHDVVVREDLAVSADHLAGAVPAPTPPRSTVIFSTDGNPSVATDGTEHEGCGSGDAADPVAVARPISTRAPTRTAPARTAQTRTAPTDVQLRRSRPRHRRACAGSVIDPTSNGPG